MRQRAARCSVIGARDWGLGTGDSGLEAPFSVAVLLSSFLLSLRNLQL